MSIKITHTDHVAQTTTTIECENINTLKEIGLIRISPKMSASAEAHYFGKFAFRRNIVLCQQYDDCPSCPQFMGCNNLED